MNNLDKQYTDLLQDILDNGVTKSDRTGTGTISVFGRQIRHKMSEGFPLLTTKKMAWKTMVTELLWFLRGDTNIKFLVDNNCHIWDGDAYNNYCKKVIRDKDIVYYLKSYSRDTNGVPTIELYSKDEFIERIKNDDVFAKKWGELGPVYGKQWRSWEHNTGDTWTGMKHNQSIKTKIDQIANLIRDLKTNPDSRRLMVNAWNVGELDSMVLPPCHYGFQVYTRELSLEERKDWWNKSVERGSIIYDEIYDKDEYSFIMDKEELDKLNIPTRAISLMWNQRSVDTFLGLPFNIASYGLLLEIIAKAVNMVPDELIGNLGDTHLYLNHVEQAKEQIGRELSLDEREELYRKYCADNFWAIKLNQTNEVHYERANIPKRTREPYPLPTLKHMKKDEFYKALSEDTSLFTHLDPTDFQVENYQAHPHIKAPLSN